LHFVRIGTSRNDELDLLSAQPFADNFDVRSDCNPKIRSHPEAYIVGRELAFKNMSEAGEV
jgi:hypothetical protein